MEDLRELRRQRWLRDKQRAEEERSDSGLMWPSQGLPLASQRPLAPAVSANSAADNELQDKPRCLKRVHIIPLSHNSDEVLKGRTRWELLAPELERLRSQQDVVSLGDILYAEGSDYIVMGAEPKEGAISAETEFFFEGYAIPVIDRIQFIASGGPSHSDEVHLFAEYVKPYFAGCTQPDSGKRRILREGDNLVFKGIQLNVSACEPEFGYVSANTEIFAQWDASSTSSSVLEIQRPTLPLVASDQTAESSSRAAPIGDASGRTVQTSTPTPALSTPESMLQAHTGSLAASTTREESNDLKQIQILPLSAVADQRLEGRSRLDVLMPELLRIQSSGEVLQVGSVLSVDGVDTYIVFDARPAEGTLSSETRVFTDGEVAPLLDRIYLIGTSGPRDSGCEHFVSEYLKPYFSEDKSERCERRSRKWHIVAEGDVLNSNGAQFVVQSCEPGSFGVVTQHTVISGEWDQTPEFQRIHFVPFEQTVPRGHETEVFELYLKPYLQANAPKQFSVDDVIFCEGVKFIVACCEPDGPRRLGSNTEIFWQGYYPMELHCTRSTMNGMHVQDLYSRWKTGRVRAALPQYQRAVDLICVSDRLMTSSRLGHRLKFLEERMRLRQSPDYVQIMTSAALYATRKAFGMRSDEDPRAKFAEVAGLAKGNMFQGAMWLYHGLTWEKYYLAEALCLLCDMEDAAGLQITLGLMRRGADECHARKVYSFNAIISRIAVPTEHSRQRCDDSDVGRAREAVLDILIDLVEETKDKALKTTFLEPTKMYFQVMGLTDVDGSVDTHGINTYLALLVATLGVDLSRRPFMHDDTGIGVADFLRAGMDRSLAVLWKPENFGADWGSIGELRREKPVARRAPMFFIFNECVSLFGSCHACNVANEAINPKGDEAKHWRVAQYLEQFAFWFSEDFILPRMISRLIGEEGRLEALRLLRDDLARRETCWAPEEGEDDVRFWLWDMDVFPAALHTDRARRLLQHAGALHQSTHRFGDSAV